MASDLPPPAAARRLARSQSDAAGRAGHGAALGYEYIRPSRPYSQGPRPRLSGGDEQQQQQQRGGARPPPLARHVSAGSISPAVLDRRRTTDAEAAGLRTPRQPIRAAPGGAPTSPLFDLLQHVDSLISEFDNKLKKRSNVF
jgi:hypothetical protein